MTVPLRAALYLRVSTADQKPDLQYDDLRAYAARTGLRVVQDYWSPLNEPHLVVVLFIGYIQEHGHTQSYECSGLGEVVFRAAGERPDCQ